MSSAIFTLMQLPCELRAMIWDLSIPEDISEVCILLKDTSITGHDGKRIYKPFTVDTAFPILMHVCNESRKHAMEHTRFRFSAAAQILVPYRHLRPELDILYIHGMQDLGSLRSLKEPLFDEIRYLALGCWRPLCATTPSRPSSAMCVFAAFPRLQSISFVLPSSKELPSRQKTYPMHPSRRFRLEPADTGRIGSSNIIAAFKHADCSTNGVLSLLHSIRCDIALYRARQWHAGEPGEEGGYIELDLGARYFASWSCKPSLGAQGAFCDSLQFPEGFVTCGMTEMKVKGGLNPEEIRVNDLGSNGRDAPRYI